MGKAAARIARAVLTLVLGLGLMPGAVVPVGLHQDRRAEGQAREFCAAIPTSSPVAATIARAEDMTIRHYASSEGAEHVLMFRGCRCVGTGD